jgi:hypothetical protein
MGGHPSPECDGMPIGTAFPIAWIPARKGPPVQVFRLQVRKTDLEGEWICKGRQFIRLGETCEEV